MKMGACLGVSGRWGCQKCVEVKTKVSRNEAFEDLGRSIRSSIFGRSLKVPEPLKVCRIMAFWAIFRGVGLLFYLLFGSRSGFVQK